MSSPDGPPAFRLFGQEVLDRWLATGPDASLELDVWLWLSGLFWQHDQHPAVQTFASATEQRWSARIPGTNVGVSYIFWPAQKALALVEVANLP